MAKGKIQVIDAREFTIEEWLGVIFTDKKVFPTNCFPNDKAKDDYLKMAKDVPEREVVNLLRHLLPKTNRLGHDKNTFNWLLTLPKEELEDKISSSEYFRRNFFMRDDVWEGLTWVLDLLPDHPKDAISSINAYYTAQCQFMTDQQMDGIRDCAEIIRAKYFDVEHPQKFLSEIEPIEFEWLVEELYQSLGYKTELTKLSYDDGIDIIAIKSSVGKKEKALIQCKRYKRNISVTAVRELNGVVDGKASKGIVITSSEFTKEALKFAEAHPRIELIGYRKLNKLLNMHLSPKWPFKMDNIFRDRRRKKVISEKSS